MELFDSMISGFHVALSLKNLLYCLVGVLLGMVVGVLPGLGTVATIALLLPLTYNIPPETSIIMLAGIYYGTMYGGSITSILMDMPGEASSVVTTFDGYQMAKQGKAGVALGISAIGSFIAGTVAIIGLSLLAPVAATFALKFGPPEYTMLAVFGVLLVSYLSTKSVIKSVIVALLGLLLSTIGQDPIEGSMRFTMGITHLMDGLDFTAMTMGLFGVAEVLHTMDQKGKATLITSKVSRVWPSLKDWAESKWAIARGSAVGFLIGILPGGGAIISPMLSYAIEKRVSKHPEQFGKGAIEGVAGPESANNASAGSAFIPLLTMGIPSNAVMALIYGALLIHGITPGPLLIKEHPEIFWGVIDSMYVGNIILLLLSIPLVGIFVKLLRVRMGILGPVAIMMTMIGVYTINNSIFDMWCVIIFGVLGYLMRKFGFDAGPLVLAFVLGPILETSFRQSMLISDGSFAIFATRPLAGSILAGIALLVLSSLVSAAWKRRKASKDAAA
ncbi:tripartite tricarboxylate transporter permease [Paenibacillus filicis]|uniref:Tripartite tricarboxylate transporter permease n=1 Tax=Paenibacillus filicis TaxID=669464 RepID=A0ABU9DCG9_9BACL